MWVGDQTLGHASARARTCCAPPAESCPLAFGGHWCHAWASARVASLLHYCLLCVHPCHPLGTMLWLCGPPVLAALTMLHQAVGPLTTAICCIAQCSRTSPSLLSLCSTAVPTRPFFHNGRSFIVHVLCIGHHLPLPSRLRGRGRFVVCLCFLHPMSICTHFGCACIVGSCCTLWSPPRFSLPQCGSCTLHKPPPKGYNTGQRYGVGRVRIDHEVGTNCLSTTGHNTGDGAQFGAVCGSCARSMVSIILVGCDAAIPVGNPCRARTLVRTPPQPCAQQAGTAVHGCPLMIIRVGQITPFVLPVVSTYLWSHCLSLVVLCGLTCCIAGCMVQGCCASRT